MSFQSMLLSSSEWPSELAIAGLTPRDVDGCLSVIEELCSNGTLEPHTTNWKDITNIIGCYKELAPSQQGRLINMIFDSFKSSITERMPKEKLELYTILSCILVQQIEKNQPLKGREESSHSLSFFIDSCLNLIKDDTDWLSSIYDNSTIELESLLTSLVRTLHLIVEVDYYHQNHQKLIAKICDFFSFLAIEDDMDCCGHHPRFSLTESLSCTIIQDLSLLGENVALFSSSLISSLEVKSSFVLADLVLPSLSSHLLSLKSSKNATESNTKSIQAFLSSTSKNSPLSIQRQLHSLADLMDYEQSGIRMTMTELFTSVIKALHQSNNSDDNLDDDRSRWTIAQQKSLFEVIFERSLDTNAFVRAKVLSSLIDVMMVCNASQKDRLLKIAIQRLMDKSSAVRRKSISLLQALLRNHPFSLDGGLLDAPFFALRLREVKHHIQDFQHNGNESTLEGEKLQQNLLIQEKYYSDALAFTLCIEDRVIPLLLKLMEITSIKGEMCDIMDFFVDSSTFGLKNSDLGLNRMLLHVWERVKTPTTEMAMATAPISPSEDANLIREHLLLCFSRLYIEVDPRLSILQKQQTLFNNLLKLLNSTFSTPSSTLISSCIECISIKLASLPSSTVKPLFLTAFKKFMEGISLIDARSSLVILSIGAQIQPNIIKGGMIKDILEKGLSFVRAIGSHDLQKKKKECLEILQYLLSCLQSLYGHNLRLPLEDPIVYSISSLLFLDVDGSFLWLEGCNRIIRCLSLIVQDFITLSRNILSTLDTLISSDNTWILSRNIHIASSIASHLCSHFDVIQEDLLKRIDIGHLKDDGVDETSLISKSEEENIKEMIRVCREDEMMSSEGGGSPLYLWAMISIRVFESSLSNPSLLIISSIALTKFMTVSQTFCDTNLSLFLTLLTRHPLEEIRMNCILGFADLATCHSRIIDQNVKSLFLGLVDKSGSSQIRTRTLTILTHLFLTGMIKVKGWIGWIARAQLDPSSSVRGMAKLFFQELTGKDPLAIYNYIPEIISALSIGSGAGAGGNDINDDNDDNNLKPLSHDEFKIVAKTIFEYVVRKERQMESLVERLCGRIRGCKNWRQIRDITFCITLVVSSTTANSANATFSCYKKLIESFPLYRDRLHDDQVFSYMEDILQRAKKQFIDQATTPNPSITNSINEWEDMIREAAGEDATDLMEDIDITSSMEQELEEQEDPLIGNFKLKKEKKKAKPSALDIFKSSVRSNSESGEDDDDNNDDMAMMDIDVSSTNQYKKGGIMSIVGDVEADDIF